MRELLSSNKQKERQILQSLEETSLMVELGESQPCGLSSGPFKFI